MKRTISIFELSIMILAVFAFSYILDASLVDAEEISFSCCEKTNEGAVCQNVVSDNQCLEGARLVPSECEATSFCRLGCCIDDEAGTYDKNVPEMLCEGRWVDKPLCDISEASLGCCVLDDSTSFVTDSRCDYLANIYGVEKDYRNMGEAECVLLSSSQSKGACVVGDGCEFLTQQGCSSKQGEFYEDYLCTNDELNTGCNITSKTTCVDGRDGVYFVDSCGNPANVYDYSKRNDNSYWQKVVPLHKSCGAGNGNANSKECGNCDRFLGGICSSALEDGFDVSSGDFYCKDTGCLYQGESYDNGESWCVYDGKIGEGDDVVGSRHWKYVCSQGEILIEPCADYRNQICVQADTTINGSREFSNANCRPNNWKECSSLNSDDDDLEACSEALDCMIKEIKIADSFSFDVCVPQYPGGFDINSEAQQSAATEVCSMASQTCTVIYQEKSWGGCECVANCECEEAIFSEEMNDFCRSLGDCGGHVNIEGEYTENYNVINSPKLGKNYISDLVKMSVAKNYPDQKAEVGNLTEYLVAAGLYDLEDPEAEEDSGGGLGGSMGKVGLGAAGIGFAMYSIAPILGFGGGLSSWMAGPVNVGGFAGAMIAAGIGMFAGSMLAKIAGTSPGWSMVATISGGVAGVMLAGYFMEGIMGGACFDATTCLVIGVIALIVMIASLFFGSDCEPVEVEFTCEPWQPPVGGDGCEKCNEDPLKPCSEYRCESLGASCELLNKGTTEEMCVDARPDDSEPPRVEPRLGLISENHKYEKTEDGFKITSLNGGCLNAYENFYFGITTNEPAQCKFDLEIKDYEDMSQTFGINAYTYNHTTTFILPDPSHGQSQGIDWNGDLNMYVKCRDTKGNEMPGYYNIEMCVNQGPDNTAPVVKAVEPGNDGLIALNETEKEVKIYVSEPSECRWSFQDTDYVNMENDMECVKSLTQMEQGGYLCSDVLPVNSSQNEFYIRCKDQPWLNASGNVNQESFVYILRKPESELGIDWIEPSEDLEVEKTPTEVVLNVKTSGGAGGDLTKCSYSFTGDRMIPFFNTYSEVHEQKFNLNQGRKRIFVECEDTTGDVVREDISFRILVDKGTPQLARVYQNGNKMTVITSEDAECVFTTKDCNYKFDEGDSAGSGLKHSFSVVSGNKYYIRCKDKYGNLPGGCSAIVMAG